MADIEKDKIKVPEGGPCPSKETQVDMINNIAIVITQAFCPNGHNLISKDDVNFEGYKGIKLWVNDGKNEGWIILSPIHGDHRKVTNIQFDRGTKLQISCPHCKTQFQSIATCSCDLEGDLVKLYLTPKLSDSHIVAVCNIWGCPNSRVIDNFQIIAEYEEIYDEEDEEE